MNTAIHNRPLCTFDETHFHTTEGDTETSRRYFEQEIERKGAFWAADADHSYRRNSLSRALPLSQVAGEIDRAAGCCSANQAMYTLQTQLEDVRQTWKRSTAGTSQWDGSAAHMQSLRGLMRLYGIPETNIG